MIPDNQLGLIEDSNTVKKLLREHIRPQLVKQIWMDRDTALKYIYQGLEISKRIGYEWGIQKMYKCLSSAYRSKGPQDSAQFYFRHIINRAEDQCDTGDIIFYLVQLGRSFSLESKFDSAIYVTEKAAQYTSDSVDKISILSLIPKFYLAKGDYANGAKLCHEIIELAKLYKDTADLVSTSSYLAQIYARMGMHDKEMNSALVALKFGENAEYVGTLHYVYSAAAEAYYHQLKYDSAIYYALKYATVFYGGGTYVTDLTLGSVFKDSGQIDSAIFYVQRNIDSSIRYKFRVGPEPYSLLGSCALVDGDVNKATEYFLKAEKELEQQDILINRGIYKSLYECYNTLGQPAKALLYLEKYTTLEDSMNMSQKSFAIAMMESEKDAVKLEGQIHWLTENNQLHKALNQEQRQQKNIVYASTAFILVLSLIGFLRFRKQKELKNKQSLLNERLRISRDLHDEVGATLSGIAMYSHVAKEQMKKSDTTEVAHSLDIMQKSAGEMVNKLSDIVWLINPDQDTIHQLFDRLEDYGQEMASTKNMIIKMDISSGISDFHLPLEARRNIYLFCKEAINNAIKYSRGKVIELNAKDESGYLRFSVKDDGIGFDQMTVKKGNGLTNLNHRAEEIGARFNLESKPFHGTRIELSYKVTQ